MLTQQDKLDTNNHTSSSANSKQNFIMMLVRFLIAKILDMNKNSFNQVFFKLCHNKKAFKLIIQILC